MKCLHIRSVGLTWVISAIVSSLLSSPVLAAGSHGDGHDHAKKPEVNIGMEGDSSKVSRTITILMYDNYFEPKTLSLKEGETVRFKVSNRGEFVHEFNIATAAMHAAHQKEMMGMMESGVLEMDRIRHDKMAHGDGHGMKHDHANSTLLEPGQSGEIVWTFKTHAKLEFACNVPGHYESGMNGSINLSH